jgi:hypothetical protein
MKNYISERVIDQAKFFEIRSELLRQANSVVDSAKRLGEYNIKFTMVWYLNNASTPQKFNEYITALAKVEIGQIGSTFLDPKKELKDAVLAKYNDILIGCEKQLATIRSAIHAGIIKFADSEEGLTYDLKSIEDFAREKAEYTIDTSISNKYFNLLNDIIKSHNELINFEKEHGLDTISDCTTSTVFDDTVSNQAYINKCRFKDLVSDFSVERFLLVFGRRFIIK